MNRRDWDRLPRAAEKQGFRTRRTRNGWVVYSNDGKGTAGFHLTPSDHRAYRNAVADLRKIGVAV